MGTMIQAYGLGEREYRGERFADWPRDLKGNSDLLSLTQPDDHPRHPLGLPRGRRRHHRDQLVHLDRHLAGGLRDGGAGLRAEPRRGHGWRGRRRTSSSAATPDAPRFVAGVLGPTNRTASLSPDVNDPGFRNVDVRRAGGDLHRGGARDCSTAAPTCSWSRPSSTRSTPRRRSSRSRRCSSSSGVRVPVMISGTITDASGRTLSGQTTEAFWNSVAHARPLSVGLNCALGAQAAPAVRAGALAGGAGLRERAPERRPAERVRRVRRDAGAHGRRAPRVRRAAGWSTSWAAAAAPRRRTSAPSPTRCAACRPRQPPGAAAALPAERARAAHDRARDASS